MRSYFKLASVAVVALGLAAPGLAAADTLTFADNVIDRLDLAGPQIEGAFTYQATVGEGWEAVAEGNPGSALVTFFNGEGAFVGDTVEIGLSGGGAFTFDSVDFKTRGGSNSDQVTITGTLGGAFVGSLDLNTSDTTYSTVASGFGGLIDLLTVEVTFDGNNALFLDNFVISDVNEVPLPAGLPLLAAGVAVFGIAGWRRKQSAS